MRILCETYFWHVFVHAADSFSDRWWHTHARDWVLWRLTNFGGLRDIGHQQTSSANFIDEQITIYLALPCTWWKYFTPLRTRARTESDFIAEADGICSRRHYCTKRKYQRFTKMAVELTTSQEKTNMRWTHTPQRIRYKREVATTTVVEKLLTVYSDAVNNTPIRIGIVILIRKIRWN